MGSRTHSALMRAAALLAALLGMPWAGLTVARAAEPQIRSIDIEVTLHRDGSASFTEDWDVTVAEGTEWYLVRQNLDGMEVSGLSVTDETGRRYADIGEWDIDRSMAEKAGRSGIRHSGDGVELRHVLLLIASLVRNFLLPQNVWYFPFTEKPAPARPSEGSPG